MIADEVINEIRARADIVAVIGQHVQLKKAGRNWKGLCPFHGEKTPSFNVSPDKGFFHCFGCQKHGDVFTFVMELEGKSFVEAAEQLGARFGVEVPKIDESPEIRRARGERVAMLDINKHAAAFFREALADAKHGEPGRAYLAKRGVEAEITDKFQLGYGPADWHALADYLKAKHVDLELAAKLGLVGVPRQRGSGYFDKYRERLVCPVIVPGGEIVGFSARVVGNAEPSPDGYVPPKYINSPESAVYKKSRLLFGLAQAREGMQQVGRATLVEGNFDVITLHQAGFNDVVAPLGTALTLEQVLTLKRLTDRVVLLYDGDKAGYKATIGALQTCVEAELEVQVARRPGRAGQHAGEFAGGDDPDSIVASGRAEELRDSIKSAVGGIEFFCFEVWGKARNNADARTRAIEDAARLVIRMPNPIKRDLVIDTTAKALDVGLDVVRAAVARAGGRSQQPQSQQRDNHPNHPNRPPEQANSTTSSKRSYIDLDPEVEFIALLADHPSLIASAEADKAFWLLTDETLRAMYSAAREGQSFMELASKLPAPTARLVLSGKYTQKDPRKSLAAMLEGFEARKRQLDNTELQKRLETSRQGSSDKELVRLQARLAEAQRRGDRDLAERLAGEISSNRKQAE